MEWQPIETAPKDGTDVILHCLVEDKYGKSSHSTMVGHWSEGRFVVSSSLSMGPFGQISIIYMPWTHWMTLPAPPEASQ